MKKVKNPIKPEDIKLGSDDMVFWEKVVNAHKAELKTLEDAARLTKKILEMAEENYALSEKEFHGKV